MQEQNVSPTPHGRKPSSWPLPHREWKRPPHRPTAEGERWLRPVIADRVKQATARSSVHAALQTHLDGALVRIAELYKGERLLGRETAVLIVSALRRALASARPPRLEAGARAFCADLGIHVGTAVASAALAIVLLVTPVLRRPSRYRWLADLATLKACRHGDMALESVLSWPFLTPESAAETDASEQDDAPRDFNSSGSPDEAHIEHACGVVPSPYSAADEVFGEPEDLGGLGGASAPPAEQAGASPATPPASDGDAPLREPLTLSGYLQALPKHRRQQQAVALLRQHGPVALTSAPRAAAQDLLRLRDSTGETRAYPREVEALSRALAVLRDRGDLGEGFALPRFALHPWAVLLGIKARPSDIRPTAGQVRYLRARGINPAGLSRPEAKAMQGLLQLRKGEAMAWPRQMERFIAAHGWGERLARACAAGMIDDGLRGSIEHLRQLAMSAYFELMAVRRSRTVH